jgi:hypothetical protein
MPGELPHLRVDPFFSSRPYTYPAPAGGTIDTVDRD